MNNQETGVWQSILKAILFLPALVYLSLRESASWLQKKTYTAGWWSNLVIGLAGLLISMITTASFVEFLSTTLTWSLLAWFPASAAVLLLSNTHVWPVIYLVCIKPLFKLCNWLLSCSEHFVREFVKPVLLAFTLLLRKAPGAERLWGIVEGKDGGKRWGIRFLQVLLLLCALLLALWPGLSLYGALLPLASASVLTFLHLDVVLSASLAFALFYYLAAALLYLLDEGDEALAVVVYAVLLSGAVFYFVSAPLGHYAIGAAVVSFPLSVCYVVPSFVAVLQGGWVEGVLKAWDELLVLTYNDSDLSYRRFYHHSMNLVLAGSLGYVVASVLLQMTVSPFVSLPLASLAALFAYSKGSEDLLEADSGNALIGLGLALLSAYWLSGLAAVQGVWLVPAVIAGTLLNSFLFFPLLYKALKVCLAGCAEILGTYLKRLHSWSINVLDFCYSALRRVEREAFGDTSEFSPLLGHGLNFAFAAWSTWQISAVALTDFAFGGALSWLTLILVGINLFILTDRFVSHYGAETLAVGAGGGAALFTWQAAMAATGSELSSFIVCVFACLFSSAVLAPLTYLGLRYLAKGVITPWLAPIVSKFTDLVWRAYKSAWRYLLDALAAFIDFLRPVLDLARRVLDFAFAIVRRAFSTALRLVSTVLQPLGMACVSAWRAARAMLDRLSGKN
ncbi:MAG: hypothetical protein HY986_16900 [Candidatus Melainabacteria bacterium]|nr:hypothetical protein [Candidatus Melainabacteria bacterium]